MAKKKSSDDTKSQPAKKEPAKKPSAARSGDAPQIDTTLAANTAAAMIASKAGSAQAPAGVKKESAAFKQFKAGLNKPSAGALGGVFGTPQQQKKTHQTFGGGKQIGHQQTHGTDATRTGVPRRTPG
jgi:hypothetical protein